ncbi:Alkylphosphonate utilization operon protein PhnA [hydrothermal vent metagenome]|uniref:Alkylphosphonate utilization operon protein PhnA n=1 Tax=hydrothermal vent metagenome TaxID=652676 RepID=A0A1W1C1S8_9ZZZZ
MSYDKLMERSGGVCELCSSSDSLSGYEVSPSDGTVNQSILLCKTCKSQIENPDTMDSNHWRCLNDSMWNQEPAVQVMAYRILKKLGSEDLLSMLYLEPEVQLWADANSNDEESSVVVKDSNGNTLEAGDSVTIIKDLEVKGAGFTAKRGTVVKNIGLNGIEGQIEGRVNGTRIVLLSKFLKKV